VDPYQQKPWLQNYPPRMPVSIVPAFPDLIQLFRAAVSCHPSNAAVHYFDRSLTYQEVDALSDSLAVWLNKQGIGHGDRIALILQNVPQFLIVLIAAWKTGAIAVPINPMNRERELGLLFKDCTPRLVVCHPAVAAAANRALYDAKCSSTPLLATSPHLFQKRNDSRVLPSEEHTGEAEELLTLISAHAGQKPRSIVQGGGDVAVILYTSGTTGLPKGAQLTHANACFSAQVFRDWIGLGAADSILAIAPLFHVTGLIAHVILSLLTKTSLILGYRFEPNAMLDAIAERRPQFAIGAITAFLSLMNAPDASRSAMSSFKSIFSGGSPIAPAVVAQYKEKFGHYIHNSYGLTESTSPAILVPCDRLAPVDPVSGALSIGVPVFDTEVRIADELGNPLAAGELGEILVRGPQVMAGYWNKPAATAEALKGGWLHTGDIGFMDPQGWFYLVDRKKDMINASGFKVWPREVEDVLYTHPAILEAAVVGVQDAYRGETVKAVVSLKAGYAVSPEELIAFCKELLAAYKYPRVIEIRDELPKTVSGKILRRELR
jgi:long-chain acyl-CoA synthetase